MTVTMEAVEVKPADVFSVLTPRRKSRRGSETRQRTEQVKLSLLPAERQKLERVAADAGFAGPGMLQQFIRSRLAGDLSVY
jgi:hypothetical protein